MACSPQQKKFEVSNPLAEAIKDKAVVLTRQEVATYLAEPLKDQLVIALDAKGEALPTQNDDVDGDGKWDELVFLTNIDANARQEVSFRLAEAGELDHFPKRTNIRFGYKNEPCEEVVDDPRFKTNDSPSIFGYYQMEGPTWENDVVGFRNYYDARNGIDIFGKKTTAMALDSAGIRGQNYHQMDEWGMDVLKVGNSLGAGGLALQVGDSIYRIGPCEVGRYRFICEGPVRAMLELTFKGFKVQDRSYNITHRLSIYAGDQFYRSQVWIEGLQGDEQLVTGIVDKHDLSYLVDESGDYLVYATHGHQAYTHECLGLALLVKKADFVAYKAAPKEGEGILETHLLKLKPQQPTEFAFVVGWEYRNKKFSDKDFFMDVCKKCVNKL
ncbi:DUF4861 domain-containing protein [Marinilabiliaceae bacterium JC017]|nr:DUF4861 domain-containing protein [Marinilabiliaceae bacterium JC017]